MKADNNFDLYESAAIIVPGAFRVFGSAQAETLGSQTVSLQGHWFGNHYARDMFVPFLQFPMPTPSASTVTGTKPSADTKAPAKEVQE